MKRRLALGSAAAAAAAILAASAYGYATLDKPQNGAVSAATTTKPLSTSYYSLEREHHTERAERSQTRPTPTPTKSSKPKPTPTKSTSPSARSTNKPPTSTVGHAATLACIRKHESGGNYKAINSTGKFRGAYQFHQGYAPAWAERYGYPEWAGKPSNLWPPAVQDSIAYQMGKNNRYAPWREHTSYDCPGF